LGKTYFANGFLWAMGSAMSTSGFSHHHAIFGAGMVINKTALNDSFKKF
jgi:hypothetical protein